MSQVNKMSLNDMAALQLVLEDVSVRELLSSAMEGFASKENTHAQDNADLCSKAVHSFLN